MRVAGPLGGFAGRLIAALELELAPWVLDFLDFLGGLAGRGAAAVSGRVCAGAAASWAVGC